MQIVQIVQVGVACLDDIRLGRPHASAGDLNLISFAAFASDSQGDRVLRDDAETRPKADGPSGPDDVAEREARYRSLLENTETGFCIIELKFDAEDRAIDYRIAESNAAAEQMTGLTNAAGRWISEMAPGLERHWFDRYGEVALSGKAVRFENQVANFGYWYDVQASRIGSAEDRRVAVLFNDITTRKGLEERQAALLELNDTLRSLNEVGDVAAEASRILGLALRASRAGYGVLSPDDQSIRILPDWASPGLQSVEGTHRFIDYGAHGEELMAGQVVAIADVLQDPRMASDPSAVLALGSRAVLDLPLLENSRAVAQMFVHCEQPRDWSDADIGLVREFAERIRSTLARREAEATLRDREDELRRLTDSLPALVSVVDADERYRLANDAYRDWFDIAPESLVGRTVREVVGEEAYRVVQPRIQAAMNGERVTFEDYLAYQSGGGRHVRVDLVPRRTEPNAFAGYYAVIQDISERHNTERRQAALIALNDALRDLTDPAEIEHTSSQILAEALGVSRVGYGVMDTVAETVTIARDYNAPGVQSIAGVIHFRDFGTYVEDLVRGETVIFADAARDPRVEDRGVALAGIRATSLINMPLMERGKVVALLFVNNATPREWPTADVDLVREVAERVRTASERARAMVALRTNEARLRFLDALNVEVSKLTDADAILATTTRMTAQHLGVENCAYADMDEDQNGFTIRGDWTAPGMASIVGHYQLVDFGRLAVQELGAARPLIINDNLKEIAPEEAATFQAIGISATLCIPLVKAGRLTALMALHHARPHVWTDEELATIREVTERSWAHVERVKAEATLRSSETHLAAMFEQTVAGLAEVDLSGRFTWVNDRYCEIVGRDREALLNLTMQEITHPEDLAANVPMFRALVQDGTPFDIEKRYLRPDQSEIWVSNSVSAISRGSGDVKSVLAVTIDITERKRVEAELWESESRYRTLFDTVDEGFCIIEFVDGPEGPYSDYIHVEANRAAGKQAGLADVQGRSVRDLIGDEASEWVDLYGEVLRTGRPIRVERELVTTGRWLEVAAFRIEPPERRQVAVLI